MKGRCQVSQQRRRRDGDGTGRGPARPGGRGASGDRGARRSFPEGGDAGRRGDRTGGRPGAERGADRGAAGRRGGAGRPEGGPRRQGQPRTERPRSAEQARYDGPPLDEAITGAELDRSVRQQLRGLPEKLAARVARHLVAAGRLIDTDPRTAYQHTLAARARAPRVAVVREACGEAAYASGEYAEALAELRAARRINGAVDYLPVMADCERALGRPEKALALAKSPAAASLPPHVHAEMTIVAAGARRDMGEVEAALRTLESAPLRSRSRADWVVRLRYAYADALLAAGRRDEAVQWFHRTVGIDSDGITDAAERIADLEGVAFVEDVEGFGASPGPEPD